MASNPQYVPIDPRTCPCALRLTFSYEGEHVDLSEIERVQMIAPASVTPLPSARNSGFWVEVRDAGDRVLFHRVLHDPFRLTIEVHSPDKPIRIERPGPLKGAFEVLVPDIPGATALVLFGSPAKLDRASEPASELARFELTQAKTTQESC